MAGDSLRGLGRGGAAKASWFVWRPGSQKKWRHAASDNEGISKQEYLMLGRGGGRPYLGMPDSPEDRRQCFCWASMTV